MIPDYTLGKNLFLRGKLWREKRRKRKKRIARIVRRMRIMRILAALTTLGGDSVPPSWNMRFYKHNKKYKDYKDNKDMVKINCPSCKNQWDYTGKYQNNPKAKVICPACRVAVSIADNTAKV